jgi:hypothetical protein
MQLHIKLVLDGQVLGELDADSVKQLEAFNYIKDGNPLNLKLITFSESKEQTFILGSSPNGNLLKVNKINHYDYKGEIFSDAGYRRVTLEVPPLKTRDAVFLNGEPLGVLHFKKDKEALKELGVLKFGRLTPIQATLQSNISTTMMVKIDPNTIQYPQTWTKENQVFDQQIVNEEQQAAIGRTTPILQKIKERPTMLVATPSYKSRGLMGLTVDNHKIEAVNKWLTAQNVKFSLAPTEDVIRETKKGLAVFNLVSSSIPPKTLDNMTKKFGAIIESTLEYQQFVSSLATRPQFLKPPEQTAQSPPNQSITPLLSTNPSTTDIINSTKTEPLGVEKLPTVTIDDLRNWYNAADKLGKPLEYKNRIVEVANSFKSGQPLSSKAFSAMNQDTTQHRSLSRLTQIAQRISHVLGKPSPDGSTQVSGKVYNINFNSDCKNLTITQKNGDVILAVVSAKVQVNHVSDDVIQAFEAANTKLDQALSPVRSGGIEL